MRERHQGGQGGSLAGFIIVGALLALVLVGGLYGLNRYNAQRASEEASQQEEQPAKEEQKSEESTDKDKSADTSSDQSATPAAGSDSSSDTSDNSSAATTANLPETGPADTTISLLALGILSFAFTHYVRSRRSANS